VPEEMSKKDGEGKKEGRSELTPPLAHIDD